ncbi:MAG: heme ABC transporter ATP-binding protein [Halanaeroarchaeum sp.]
MDGRIRVDDVTVRLGGQRIIDDVSLSVDEGRFVALIGPNGAGKTTLLRTISGILAPETGTVRLGDDRIGALSSDAVSRRVAVVPQNTNLAFAFDVRDVVEMGRTPYQSRVGIGDAGGDDLVAAALDRTDVAHLAERSIEDVSGGERQRVLLARALAQDTPILLLDEPTASLDINHQVRTLELVRSLVDEGQTVIAAIHDLNLAAHYADELLLLADGELLSAGPPADVLTEANLEASFGTNAVVTSHPVTGSVYVMALPEGQRRRSRARVHVVGGGGTAARLLYLLVAAGFEVTAGALNEGDADLETARLLGVDAVTVGPGEPMSDAARTAVSDCISAAAVTVVADVEVGHGNLDNLRAARDAENVVMVEKRDFAERNFAGERASAVYESLRADATLVESGELIQAVTRLLDRDDGPE